MLFPKGYRIENTKALEECKLKPCLVCGRGEADPHHLKSRGAGGDDVEWNLIPLCRNCHTAIHKMGLTTFAKTQSVVKEFLVKNGWELLNDQWRHHE